MKPRDTYIFRTDSVGVPKGTIAYHMSDEGDVIWHVYPDGTCHVEEKAGHRFEIRDANERETDMMLAVHAYHTLTGDVEGFQEFDL